MKIFAIVLFAVALIVAVAQMNLTPAPAAVTSSAAPIPVQARPKPITRADMIAARKAAAKVLDDRLLEAGVESRTEVQGPDATKLVIHSALASRVSSRVISQNGTLLDELRELKFKKLIYTDDYDETFTWDLNK